MLIFLEKKGLKVFQKSLRATKFYKKVGQKKIHKLLCFHLIQN
jgi:hypothetical protein